MKKSVIGGIAAAVLTVLLATPAQAAEASVIHVPDDFAPTLSDTRAAGHYEVVGTGLHIWTEADPLIAGGVKKVAEYVATSKPLTTVGEPSLSYTATTGTTPPGFQLVVDFDNDGSADGILIGEPGVYGNTWWLNNGAKQFVKDGAPNVGGGYGSDYWGTLDEWRAYFPNAVVTAFGFSSAPASWATG
ncbi:hypothetical protein [Naasia aerilata]|uniref:Uncharacterized protein n=1 Tax=Naasia aerilata TaxID=1162966 RepID=A0ABN6XNJ3_9MICO|nr:hypothetical protein [Naasia aerilata]BDZ46528.1 hypothetical protein GCM10025866_24370 [Naasia aerilata]